MAGDEGDDDLRRRVAELARPLAAAHGSELLAVEVKGHRNRRLVRLVADTPATARTPGANGGLDVDTIARLSREVASALDEGDLVAGSYTLEVTSPGADRPLRAVRDFRHNLGREVRVVVTDGDASTEVIGSLVDVDDEAVTLDVDGEPRRVALRHVDYGKVVLPW